MATGSLAHASVSGLCPARREGRPAGLKAPLVERTRPS